MQPHSAPSRMPRDGCREKTNYLLRPAVNCEDGYALSISGRCLRSGVRHNSGFSQALARCAQFFLHILDA